MGQSQSRVSRHLKLLTEAGLLERIREGSWVFHRLNVVLPSGDETLTRDLERLSLVQRDRDRLVADYFSRNAES
jgi:ArsR family transcriptional regulator